MTYTIKKEAAKPLFVFNGEESLDLLYDGCLGGVLHHGSDALLHGALGSVHLAGADHLAVAGLEVEIRLAVLGFLDFIAGLHGGVLLHGLYAVKAGSLGVVAFAGEDYLTVGGLKVELEFSVLSDSDNKLSQF